MIRIISGLYKGRRLKIVSSDSVRPMQDKVKGALFNILGDRVRGAVCLDGFAGTGSIGLEALSRGAARVAFVDDGTAARALLRRNIEKMRAMGVTEAMIPAMVEGALRDHSTATNPRPLVREDFESLFRQALGSR